MGPEAIWSDEGVLVERGNRRDSPRGYKEACLKSRDVRVTERHLDFASHHFHHIRDVRLKSFPFLIIKQPSRMFHCTARQPG